MDKKILVSMILVGLVAALAGAGLYAYFSDTEKSTGNTFTAGTLNLKVGDQDPTTWKITVSNMYPGQTGSTSVVVANTGSLNGKLSISFSSLVDDENGITEPESELSDDETSGELAENLKLEIFIDENGNGMYDSGTDVLIYSGTCDGITSGGLTGYSLDAGVSKTMVVKYAIDSSVGNIIQSDKAGFDITFSLVQA